MRRPTSKYHVSHLMCGKKKLMPFDEIGAVPPVPPEVGKLSSMDIYYSKLKYYYSITYFSKKRWDRWDRPQKPFSYMGFYVSTSGGTGGTEVGQIFD